MARLAMRGYETEDIGSSIAPGQMLVEQGPAGSTTVTPSAVGDPILYPTGYLGLGVAADFGTSSPGCDASLNFGAMVSGRTYFFRAMVQIRNATAVNQFSSCFGVCDSGLSINTGVGVYWIPGSQPNLQYNTASGVSASWAGSGPVGVDGQWYRVELKIHFAGTGLGSSSYELRVDGTTIYTGSDMWFTAAPDRMIPGRSRLTSNFNSATVHLLDDIAVNDDQGTAQTSWPGDGKVWLLPAVSDNARGTNWTGGAAGTTSLFDAVNNEPPVGVVTASATNTSQVKNAAKDTTGLYDVNIRDYATAGIPASHTIAVVMGMIVSGSSSTTALVRGVQLVSNPAIAESTNSTPALACGTHPSNWNWTGTAMSYSPAVTLGTSPVLRVRKGTSSTVVLNVEAMFLIVESTPAPITRPKQMLILNRALERSIFWMRRKLSSRLPHLWTPAGKALV